MMPVMIEIDQDIDEMQVSCAKRLGRGCGREYASNLRLISMQKRGQTLEFSWAWSQLHARFFITSRIGGRGNRIGAVFPSLYVSVSTLMAKPFDL